MTEPFAGFDLTDFWEDSEYARKEYIAPPFSDLDLARLKKDLGYTLPNSYLLLMCSQNGGIPKRPKHRTNELTSWAEDHVEIIGIYSISRGKTYSLCG